MKRPRCCLYLVFALSFLPVLMDHTVTHKVESGVIVDNARHTIAISRVIAGIKSGLNRKSSAKTSDPVLAATVGSELCHAMKQKMSKSKPVFGNMGQWDDSRCPQIYKYRSSVPAATKAEVYGAIDGFILGNNIEKVMKRNPSAKLSNILTEYYGDGLTIDKAIKSVARKSLFTSLMSKTNLIKQLKTMCGLCKAGIVQVDSPPDQLIENTIGEFYEKVLGVKTGSPSGSSGSSGPAGASNVIPDFLILRKYYPTGHLDTTRLLGRSIGSTPKDSVRLSHMFNQFQSLEIKPTEKDATAGSNAQLGYFLRAEHMKAYLKKMFGDPIQAKNKASLKTKAGTKGGVMVVDIDLPDGTKGVVGLWDGSKMYHVKDYTSDSRIKNINLWTSTGCAELAEQGDCSFYSCVENEIQCGDNGYALSYGQRYCKKFSEDYSKFNAEGKKWIDGVRKCLMRELYNFLNYPGKTCDNLKEFAFKSHPDCYVNSPPGFCKIWSHNKAALWSVFEIKDFTFPEKFRDVKYAWEQVADVAKSCYTAAASTLQQEINKMKDRLKKWLGISAITPQTDTESKCEDYAQAGDCRFYECLAQRFACDKEGHEHLLEFEFPSCQKFNRLKFFLSSKGKSWLKGTHRCLSQTLLPLYRSASLSCSDIRELMAGNRVKCMVDNGFCSLTEKDAFPIDRAMDFKTYPLVMKQDFETSTIMSKTVLLGHAYYRGLIGLQRQIGDAHAECHRKNLKSSKTMYTMYWSNKYKTKLKRVN